MARWTSGIGSEARVQSIPPRENIVIEVPPCRLASGTQWVLPASKSHLIRWIALGCQGNGALRIEHVGELGEDITHMIRGLESLGARIQISDGAVTVSPRDGKFPSAPRECINMGNTGTGCRFMLALASSIGSVSEITGDLSLRNRPFEVIIDALTDLGCFVSRDERGGFAISGPALPGKVALDLSKGSQPLSALLIAAPSMGVEVEVEIHGGIVSQRYLDLTFAICKSTGSANDLHGSNIRITPWDVTLPEKVKVPSESSLSPIIMLLERLHGVDLGSGNLVDSELVAPEISWLQSNDSGRLDLTAASDLVTPAAALLAIGGGGEIVGVGHTERKESNRMVTTEGLLFDFGLQAHVRPEGVIEVPGGQTPKSPGGSVKTNGDHRVAMTAMALASLVGAKIEGEGCIRATHPSFHQMLMAIAS